MKFRSVLFMCLSPSIYVEILFSVVSFRASSDNKTAQQLSKSNTMYQNNRLTRDCLQKKNCKND